MLELFERLVTHISYDVIGDLVVYRAHYPLHERGYKYKNTGKSQIFKYAVYIDEPDGIRAVSVVGYRGENRDCVSFGNGRLDAVSNAIKSVIGVDYTLESYNQHALEGTTTARAASYVSIKRDGKVYWGAGVDSDIITSSVKALVSAVNRMIEDL